jgi:hypothetical protein
MMIFYETYNQEISDFNQQVVQLIDVMGVRSMPK